MLKRCRIMVEFVYDDERDCDPVEWDWAELIGDQPFPCKVIGIQHRGEVDERSQR